MIGRVESTHPSGNDFFGTCWVVDHRNGLVLTNRHVLVAMVERLSHAVARMSTGFRVFDAPSSTSPPSQAARTCAVTGSSRQPRPRSPAPNFARLDAAVLRNRTAAGRSARGPDALTVSADPDGPLGARLVLNRRIPGPAGVRVRLHRGVAGTSPEPCSETCTGSSGSHPA